MARRWVCTDCDNAIEYYRNRDTAERHAERTGHEVVEHDCR